MKVRNVAWVLLLSPVLAFLGCATPERHDQLSTENTDCASLTERLRKASEIAEPYGRLRYYDQLVWETFGIAAPSIESTTEANRRVSPDLEVARGDNDLAYFQAIGEIRGVTADRPRRTFIMEPALGYEATNRQLYSELTQHALEIRELIDFYFSDREATELLGPTARQRVKADLRDEINALLRTGAIEDVAFVQYQIVDF